MTVYDNHKRVVVRDVKTRPEFLSVRVAPLAPQASVLGVYRVQVEVPADAPNCDYTDAAAGEIQIVTDHPLTPVLKVNVVFRVVAAGSSKSKRNDIGQTTDGRHTL
jgi:hypothetical protein